MNLNQVKNIYIIGIEGAGTSALALILQAEGKNVVGSDEGDHFYYDILKKKNIKVFHRFKAENLKNAFLDDNKIDLIIYSTSVQPEKNPELKEAMESEQHYKLLSYPQALAMVFNQSDFGIAVCGTHGKTTTTAMLGTVLRDAEISLTVLVGSKVIGWDKSGVLINQKKDNKNCSNSISTEFCKNHFVIEADEYQNKLQYYKPKAVILTSVDYDHPDFFKTPEDYKQTFKDFVANIPKDGFLVAYGGDPEVVEVSKFAQCEVIFYGLLGAKEILLSDDFCEDKGCKGKTFGCCPVIKRKKERIKLFGEHNLLNAMAVFKTCQKLGLNEKIVKKSLQEFQGTVRRFEEKGEYKGAIIVDDYAHHPVEIEVTLKMAREKYPHKNLKVVFHPHTFTRTEAFLDEFAQSFSVADEVYLLDIFGSVREKQGGVSSDDLAERIKKRLNIREIVSREKMTSNGINAIFRNVEGADTTNNKNKIIRNLHTINEAVEYFQNNLTKNDLLITMGAGDVYLIGEKILE